jgi:hypothetical protein
MTVNQKLTQIINRLDRLERAINRLAVVMSAPTPCCQPLQLPDGGGELPILPPPEPDEPVAADNVCGRVAAMLRLYAEMWNKIVTTRFEWFTSGVAGLWAVLSSGGTNPFVAAMSYTTVTQIFNFLMPILDEALDIDYENVDECLAVRQYLADDNASIPDALRTYIPPIVRPVFGLIWNLTGRGRWYDELAPVDVYPVQCCVPDTYTLYAQPASVTCGEFSYTLGIISASEPGWVIREVSVRSGELTWLRRDRLGGMWIRNVQQGGAFGYSFWLRDSPTSSGCAILRPQDGGTTPPDGSTPNMQWFFVMPGSEYILFRLPTESENSVIEVSREQPAGWDGVSTI